MSFLDQPTDAELLLRMRDADEEAFVVLFHRHRQSVYRFAAHMSGSRALAEDVAQEVFMFLMRAAERYDPERGTLQAFLLGIARNHVRRLTAREISVSAFDNNDHIEHESKHALQEVRAAADDPFEQVARDEAVEKLKRAIHSLPENYREVIVLCELQEMSYDDASQVIGCAVGTVRSRLHRARHLLAEKMHQTGLRSIKEHHHARCYV